ncbi:MAG: cadherin-like domain-containing protein [Candidatus Thermoplasmatota archaeon]|nr:cadherin-like domain-containing protein [Candidatus Thermoplasmatota archaeon]
MKRFICILILVSMTVSVFVLTGNGEEAGTRATILPPYIHNDIVFPAGEYELQHDMIIDHGVNVTFSAGSVIYVYVELTPLTMFVYGNLTLNGYGEAITQRVTFRSIASSPAPDSWNGIKVAGKCEFNADHAKIEHATIGVDISYTATAIIDGCTFDNNSIAGVRLFNYQHTNGSMYAPHGVEIGSTTFKDNGWGIIENGYDTKIDKCEFIENVEGGILVGNGSYPFSKNLKITDNDLIDNDQVAIQFGNEQEISCGITNTLIDQNEFRTIQTSMVERYMDCYLENENMVISRNTFREGYGSMGGIRYSRDLTFRSNTLIGDEEFDYPSSGGFFISDFENCTCGWNSIQNGNTYLSVNNGKNATLKYNHFTGEAQSDDDRASYIRCNNVSYAWIHNNHGENNGKIYTHESAPIWIFNNTFSSRLARTKYHEDRVVIGGTANSEKLDWVYFYDNVIFGTVTCNRMYRVKISNNIIRDSRREGLLFDYYQVEIEEVLEPSFALVENNTMINNSGRDISTGSRVSQDKMAQYEIIVKNSTFDHEEVMMEWNYSIKACWYMNVRPLNEIGLHVDTNLNVKNISGTYIADHQLSGEWQLIQGPFLTFTRGDRWYYDGVDPKYEDVLCNLTFTAENRVWNTSVNWSRYIELDLTLDASPTFTDPGTFHFDEDTILDLNISYLFQDFDPINIEVLNSDGNLTFENDTVRSTYDNWTGTSNVTFRATDSFGNITDGTVTFMVDPINDGPVISSALTEITMDEDTTFVIELEDYMYDVEGDPLEWSFDEAENLTVSLDNSTWNLTLTPNTNWFGNTSMKLHLSDGLAISNITVPVNVRSVNDAPVFNAPANWNITVFRGTLGTIDLLSMVSDVEGDGISFSMDPTSEYVTITGGELEIIFPESIDATLFTIEITADDGNGGRDTVPIRIIIDHGTAPPPEDWDLYSSKVEIDEEGNWYVEAVGMPGIDVYLVVKDEAGGTATYKLEEDSEHPGNFSLEIDSSKFEEGMAYSYFFTNATGNGDLEPDLSGIEVQPGEEVEEVFSIWALILGGICILVLVLLVMIVLIVVVVKRSSKSTDEE